MKHGETIKTLEESLADLGMVLTEETQEEKPEAKPEVKEEILPYWSIRMKFSRNTSEFWKAESEKDANDIKDFLEKKKYVLGSKAGTPAITIEKSE